MKNWSSRISYGVLGLSFLFLAGLTFSYFIEPNRLAVNHSTLTIKNWNPAFDGLRIALIGDIHGGSNGGSEENIRAVVAKTNQQNPDLVVLLGDYVAQESEDKPLTDRDLKMPVETVTEALSGIHAKYGVYAVLGNHDGWYGDDEVAAALTHVGYKVLQNEVAVIEKDGQKLRILGLKDQLKIKSWKNLSDDAKQVLADNGQTGDVIVLEHSPDILPLVTANLLISPDLRLVLAAHTHGGQVWLPVLGRPIVPSTYGQKYAYGHVRDYDMDMFVTSGTGTSVLPIRFMVPPEIAVLTIKSE
ncbi:MAG: metallophosphoesterase [Pyrinomonadaceae bacterium]